MNANRGSLVPSRLRRGATVAWLVALASLWWGAPGAHAASPIDLGAADSFAVMGGETVTNTGVSTITGDLGVSPGTAATGFPPESVSGSILLGAGAASAHADLGLAYGVAAARSPSQPIAGLGTQTLGPGVYSTGASMALAGTLTLDGQGDPGAVFIFQAGSTLLTSADSQVSLTGGTQACNVFWQVGSSATLGAASLLRGTVLASTSITAGAYAVIHGRVLARDGAVTMDKNTVAVPAPCDRALANTAPAITPFSATLTGVSRTVHTAIGAWTLGDARGTGGGYRVTVSATAPTVGGFAAAAGTGASLTLTPRTPVGEAGNLAVAGVPAGPQLLSTTAATIVTAPAGTGRGRWSVPADTDATKSLAVLIPADASAGAFSSTLTFTTAPPVG